MSNCAAISAIWTASTAGIFLMQVVVVAVIVHILRKKGGEGMQLVAAE